MYSKWIAWFSLLCVLCHFIPFAHLTGSRNEKRIAYSAYVGNLLTAQFSDQIFDKKVASFKAYSEDSNSVYLPLPEWLQFNETISLLEGVPKEDNVGEYYLTVKGYDNKSNFLFKQDFSIEVISGIQAYGPESTDLCDIQDDKTVLITLLLADYSQISSEESVRILKSYASLLNISPVLLRISEQDFDYYFLSDAILDTGPGNAKHSIQPSVSTTVVHWLVGCNGNLWADSIDKLEIMKDVAKNGTLSTVLGYPIIGWRLLKDDSRRLRREVFQTDEPSNTVDEEYSVPERRVITDSATPVFGPELSPTLPAPSPVATLRHHRHNHGDPSPHHSHRLHRSLLPSDIIEPSTSQVNIASSVYFDDIDLGYNKDIGSSISMISPSPSIPANTQVTDITEPDNEEWPSIDESVTERSTPPIPYLVDFEDLNVVKNSPPAILSRVQKISVTAGTKLRYQLSENTFFDREDGYSKNLSITFQTFEGEPISESSWIQFDENNLVIYGLPLDEHVSKWSFKLTATDSGGLSVQDTVEVVVQHYKGKRAFTHRIIIDVLSTPAGPSVNWQIALLERILQILPDGGEKSVIVLKGNTDRLPYTFIFTNSSLPMNPCPREEIEKIAETLSSRMSDDLDPAIKVRTIKWELLGHCGAKVPDPSVPSNAPPELRNHIDQLNATVGQLLLYSVPSDTFYDREDEHCKSLSLLLSMDENDSKPVPESNWLQFDDKNNEFFGIPMENNVGQGSYTLICTDSGGMSSRESLVVNVWPAPKVLYNAEFSLTLSIDYDTFTSKPSLQREFVQRLADLFGDKNTSNIILSGVTGGSTIITWNNRSLPTTYCPHDEILRLRQVLVADDEKVSSRVAKVLGKDLPVEAGRVTPRGVCQGAPGHGGTPPVGNRSDVTAVSRGEQYLVGLVLPTIVIAIMLLCAGLVACLLYRRRRSGKLSVSDDDERQSFRSKGIPVIFQDELDERPEPANKSPVIMREEKPPLAPPDYQRGAPLPSTALLADTEDAPYQPPPPFTSNRDTARPRPTPTYRPREHGGIHK